MNDMNWEEPDPGDRSWGAKTYGLATAFMIHGYDKAMNDTPQLLLLVAFTLVLGDKSSVYYLCC